MHQSHIAERQKPIEARSEPELNCRLRECSLGRRTSWLAGAGMLSALILLSAAPASGQDSRQMYMIGAVRTAVPPVIDGRLDEPAWQTAAVIDQFTQQEPNEGAPVSERTEVRILYDENFLYIGLHAFDSNPDGIVATEMRRDSERMMEEDNFQIIRYLPGLQVCVHVRDQSAWREAGAAGVRGG